MNSTTPGGTRNRPGVVRELEGTGAFSESLY